LTAPNDDTPLRGRDIVCIASSSWDAMWVNAQHLMARLARDNRVLYLNNMGLRTPGASKADLLKVRKRLGEWFAPPAHPLPNLWVLSPIAIPLHGLAPIRWLNRFLLRRRIRRWMRRLGFKRPILWTFLPTGVDLIGKLGESAAVYHCVDDYAANPNVPSENLREMETRLAKAADLTLVTSPHLLGKLESSSRKIRYFPNTADVARFRDHRGPTAKVFERFRSSNPDAKILGYQGNISGYKTDLDLLEKIARHFPEHLLVLLGPAGWGDPSTDIRFLTALANVHHLDRVPLEDLPSYIHGFDICLIPLNKNESTAGSFPMKFYEYMACGKPIVATALPAFEPYRESPQLARLADDHDSFIEAVKDSLADPGNEAAVKQRIHEAEKNDWETRVEQISAEVAGVLEGKA
jgi:glycosyltransferase involved in cell wall biosynthesis